jgi:hypothetical protein
MEKPSTKQILRGLIRQFTLKVKEAQKGEKDAWAEINIKGETPDWTIMAIHATFLARKETYKDVIARLRAIIDVC